MTLTTNKERRERYRTDPEYRERLLERQAKYRSNPEVKEKARLRAKAWREANPEKVKENNLKNSRAHYLKNKHMYIAKDSARRARKLEATPPWVDPKAVEEYYWLAKDLKAVSGENYHVDHIVPLKGKGICGLHVPWNLQVLPADLNLKKSNSLKASDVFDPNTKRDWERDYEK